MNCPNCHSDLPAGRGSCPHCGQPVIQPTDVIDAELVQDNDYEESSHRNTFYRKFIYVTPHSGNLASPVPTGMITFALAVAMGLEYGLLAFIGFLFFYALTWIASLFLRIRFLFNGQFLHPFLLQCCSWAICWFIVSRLAM